MKTPLPPEHFQKVPVGRNFPEFRHERADCVVVALAWAVGWSYAESHAYWKAYGRLDRQAKPFGKFVNRNPVVNGRAITREEYFPGLLVGDLPVKYPQGAFLLTCEGCHVFSMVEGVIHNQTPNFAERRVKNVWRVTKL